MSTEDCQPVVWIRIGIDADPVPDPAALLNMDSDPDWIQRAKPMRIHADLDPGEA
jgi:hypothetical protein